MRIHVVQHVTFEGPELIAEWAAERGYDLTESLALTEVYPPSSDVDLLVVMGGPMSADDEAAHPWMKAEKRYLAESIAAGVSVVGVCLGSQMVAEAIGGSVRRNAHPEIGWYPVRLTDAGRTDPIFGGFPDGLVVGHWHGDTFDLPDGVLPLLESDACRNQAFSAEAGRVVGMQCHLEWTPEAVAVLVHECGAESAPLGAHIQSAQAMLAEAPVRVEACREALYAILDTMLRQRA